jgi:hypothetical protein
MICLGLCLILLASSLSLAWATPGDLDTTFAGFGSGGMSDKLFAAGNQVVEDNRNMALVRYETSRDASARFLFLPLIRR